ncbi:hypothetical protein [Flavobacterium sp.]|uniref:hypothetical protein n=1 Tax=Flavobacterium sp. TaxID=239 RepID=UPI0025EF732F|nr:hypothetical protein [Flavobacterium sp.]
MPTPFHNFHAVFLLESLRDIIGNQGQSLYIFISNIVIQSNRRLLTSIGHILTSIRRLLTYIRRLSTSIGRTWCSIIKGEVDKI